MSNREAVLKLIEQIPESKINYILWYLKGFLANEELKSSENVLMEPNELTYAAIEEGERMLSNPNTVRFSSIEDLFEELNS